MRKKEVYLAFGQLGWAFDKSGRFHGGLMHLEDRIVWIALGIKKLGGYKELVIGRAVSTELFCEFTSKIVDVKKSFWRMTSLGTERNIFYRQELTYRDFKTASEQAIEWAYAQDLESRMAELGSLPLGRYIPFIPHENLPVINYLAVLAIGADVETLRRYQLLFERGEPLDFLSLVTKEFLDRALALAEAQASGSAPAQSAWHFPKVLNSAVRHRRN